MPIFDLFSKRQKRRGKRGPNEYEYNHLPNELRVQITHIWTDTLGGHEQFWSEDVKRAYEAIVNALCREYGLMKLPGAKQYGERDFLEELTDFFLREESVERALDVVEISFKSIDNYTRRWEYLHRRDAGARADNAIAELNARFKDHGVGYQFVGGRVLKVDSEFVDTNIVKPAVELFNGNHYPLIQEKFLRAYELYRHGESKEALKSCVKTCEDMLKTICDRCNWGYPKNAGLKTLIDVCIAKELVKPVWREQLSALGNMLVQAQDPDLDDKDIPGYMVAYLLNTTASTLVCLALAEGHRRHVPAGA